jgi:hypothetical protein
MSEVVGKLRQSTWLYVFVLLGYLLLTLVMTWPLVTRLGSEIAGAGTDVWIHQWTFWWIKEALQSGQNPFYTTLLYYPYGVSLTSHNIAWFNIALWLPLEALLGSVAAYNVVFILVITLNGFAFYLFAKAETGVFPAALIGGIIFGFWPYTLSHFDHPNMMVTFWAPLTMYFMLRTFRSGRVRDAVFAGLCLAMLGITRWQLLVMSAPILLAYGLYLFYREKETPLGKEDPLGKEAPWRQTAGLLLLSLGLGALLMAPLAAPLILDQFGRSGPEAVAVEEPDGGVTDLFSYVAPPDLYRAIWDEIPDPLPYPEWEPYHRISASAHYVPYIGLVTLALAFYGLIRQWRKTWFWLLLALGIMLMALGPTLAVNGRLFPAVPMPYRAIADSLLDALIRRPHRLNNFLGLPVAMIASWGTAELLLRIQKHWGPQRGRWYAAFTTILLGALILWENPIPPIPTTSTEIPDWYGDLAGEEDEFAILELPFHNRGFDKLYMFYQTRHGKPILVGHVSRLPQGAFRFLDSAPFLEPLKSIYTWNVVEESWVDFNQKDVSRQFALLAAENVRYIVLNKPLIAPGFIERWRDWVTFEPVYEDDEVLVYRTDPRAGEDFEIATDLTDGIGFLRVSLAPQETVQGGAVKAGVRWASSAAPARDYQICFFLVNDQGETARKICQQPVSGWPTSQWGADAVARGDYVIALDQGFRPGLYNLEMALVELGGTQPVGETVSLGEISVIPFDPQQKTSLCWAGDLCLRGYDLAQNEGQLEVALFWQAAAPLQESYKRFMHLVDPKDGRVVAQSDAVPRDWTYPTDIWEAQEIIADPITLPLEGVEPGSYELRAGWYAVDGGQVLPACSGDDCTDKTAAFNKLTTVEIP